MGGVENEVNTRRHTLVYLEMSTQVREGEIQIADPQATVYYKQWQELISEQSMFLLVFCFVWVGQ